MIVLDEEEPLTARHVTHSDKVYFNQKIFWHSNMVFSVLPVFFLEGMLSTELEICPLLKLWLGYFVWEVHKFHG